MKALVCLLAVLLMVACAPSTPESRIGRNPDLFASLPAKHQDLVRQGLITKGMDQNGVFLEWGDPSARLDGFRDGKTSERWDYVGSYPVFTSSMFGGFGHPGSFYGRYAAHGHGWGPSVTYLPYTRSQVWFVNRKVDAWERMR